MPHKKAKKAPKKPALKPLAEKAKKPVKPAKGAGLGVALKGAAKIGAKAPPAPSKKSFVAPYPKKAILPVAPIAKGEKNAKKGEAPKKVAPPLAPKGKAPALTLVKGVKAAEAPKKGALPPKAAVPPPAAKGKAKEKDLVVEVPAPKGVALLAKDAKGSKKAKAAEAAAAAKQRRCREPGCEHEFVLVGYCRLHYIKNWRRIKRKEAILASGQLNNYVEELVNKYPDKYLDVIRQDLASEKEWSKVVVDLELEATEDESGAEEDIDTVAEGVRSPVGSPRGEFDDDGDAF